MIWKEGGSYKGDWHGGKMHGKGEFINKAGDVYKGDMLNHLKHGSG